MINVLQGLGFGIIGFAILIGIGMVIMTQLGVTVASCPTGYVWNTNGSSIFSADKCCLTGGTDCTSAGNYSSASSATQNIVAMRGYLGTSSGGLASWIPVVIVLVIGMLFLGAFISRKGRRS